MSATSRGGGEVGGQARVISEVRKLVDHWRGFELGSATAAYPIDPARYEPTAQGEQPITDTSRGLLHHWFRHEPHRIGRDGNEPFKYWPHQRRLVETFIYLYEVRRIRRTEELYQLAGVEPLGPQRDPWAKLGGQLATGSGKTKMMSLVIAWSYLNAAREPESGLELGKHSVIIAPGLFVRDRLLQDFAPEHGGTPVFFGDPVIPPGMESDWDLKVYTPTTCPLDLDPNQGALVVTNKHQLFRSAVDELEQAEPSQVDLLFEWGDPKKLEDTSTLLLDRLRNSRGLLVINDEAHGVKDEPEHARMEENARDRDADESMSWIRSIRRLNGDDVRSGRVALQVDLSATLFEETGSDKKTKGGKKVTEFKPADLFRHTAVHYGLAEAIQDRIVKTPTLERVEATDPETGQPKLLINEGAPHAWEKYKNLLVTGIERWKKVRDQLRDEGDLRKPILFILCSEKSEAKQVANYLLHGEASSENLDGRPPKGYIDLSGERLFVEKGKDGVERETVVEIHIGKAQDSNEAEWDEIRQKVNALDRDEIPDPRGTTDADGQPVMIPNPYNVVVSVMMLKEGWDVRNVKVIVPLRPCDSRTLTEQTLGRGLRKMHAPLLDDDGAVTVEPETLFVMEHPSFETVIDQIKDLVDRKRSDEIEHTRQYVAIPIKEDEEALVQTAVRLLTLEGVVEALSDWRGALDPKSLVPLTPRLPWMERIPATEINTFLQRAMARAVEQGQSFEFDDLPSYRDFDHVIELVYVKPMLDAMKVGYQHKNGVKLVVKKFLEQKVFNVPRGAPLSFGSEIAADEARIALGNLAREDVLVAVQKALQQPLHEALTSAKRTARQKLIEKTSAQLRSHQALKKNVIEAPTKTVFSRVAVGNNDEERVARLLEKAQDVTGWLYNDRDVAYFVEYDWQGLSARYYPDFIARAKIGEVFHNFIIEVKGRYDDRDKVKAYRGRSFCEQLSQLDHEPWHYVLLIENSAEKRHDIASWEQQSAIRIAHLVAIQERRELIPGDVPHRRPELEIVEEIAPDKQYVDAVPVYDLKAAAGGFSAAQAPKPEGWAMVQASRSLDRFMFVARVVGKSMESDIPDGAWALFRAFATGAEPRPGALDGLRVLVELPDAVDPDAGGRYTLKRWRVAAKDNVGGISRIELRADNPEFKPIVLPSAGAVRVIGEFLEVVG